MSVRLSPTSEELDSVIAPGGMHTYFRVASIGRSSGANAVTDLLLICRRCTVACPLYDSREEVADSIDDDLLTDRLLKFVDW